MQLLVTHGRLARTRVLQFTRWQFMLALLAVLSAFLLFSGTVYHFVFLKAAREGWPVVSPLVRLIVRDELAQRERFMRDNLDAIAQKVGEMQAKLVRLEAMGERVQGLAGVKAHELNPPHRPASAASTAAGAESARGGPYVPLSRPSLEQLQLLVSGLDEVTDFHTDFFTLI
ncbi:MAG: peptidase M23, partial [Leptothrix sp. (in: Bacteria)]|nr:peptidase M23 [Leptothrix sp. (in: b-proteobacteria)]